MNIEELLNNAPLSKRLTKKILLIITFTVTLVFTLFHLHTVSFIATSIFSIMSPFLTGIAVAFVLNVLVKLFEERIFGALTRGNSVVWKKCKRGVCVLLSIILVVLLITGIILYVVPELINSMSVLTNYINIHAPTFLKNVTAWVNELLLEMPITSAQVNSLQINWSSLISNATQFTTDFMSTLVSFTIKFTAAVIAFIMSFIFSLYMLFDKEHLIKNMKRLLYAFLPKQKAYKLITIGTLSNKIFTGFITGQLTEAVIIGCLCYVGMSIIRLPYALLISVIISLTALIPILGAYVGGAVGAFILLIIRPIYALWFLIFLITLQQFETNIIYPRVVGTSIGLPGIWVMLSILVCGNLFGIVGILIGVPACSVIYALLRMETEARLTKKGITTEQVLTGTVCAPDTTFEIQPPLS